jgi:hypothetical protein
MTNMTQLVWTLTYNVFNQNLWCLVFNAFFFYLNVWGHACDITIRYVSYDERIPYVFEMCVILVKEWGTLWHWWHFEQEE